MKDSFTNVTRQSIYSSYINSEKIRLGLHCFNWHVPFAKQTGSPSQKGRQKHPIKNTYKILRHNWNTNHCPKAWNFPTRLNPLLLQPTLNGGATSTTPSPLTKSIGIFLLVDYEEGKKNLHLQKHSLQNISAKHMTKFNHNKTPETNPTNISSNIQHAGMLKRSIQLTPSLWISFVVS